MTEPLHDYARTLRDALRRLLVVRLDHPLDGRSRVVKLTDKGSRLAATVDRSSASHFASVLSGLNVDVAGVVDTLNTLTHAIVATNVQENCA